MSSLKWVRIVLGVIVGFVVAILLDFILPTIIGFQERGMPSPDKVAAAFQSPMAQIMFVLFALLGGFVGGRMAARPAGTNRQLAGLVTGVLLGIILVAWRAFSWGSVSLVVLAQGIGAIAGSWLAGWLAARRTDEEYDENPQL